MLSKALISTVAILTSWTSASAMVWTETADSPGEPVEFCYYDECEMTRYVTEGASGNWSFFELANGYHVSMHHSDLTGISLSRASLNDNELSRQDVAAIRLRDPQAEEAGATVSADGRFVTLRGAITQTRVAEFKTILSQHPDLVGVALDSYYGDGASALAIGNAIWDRRLSTFIPQDALCARACAVVFFSGYDRQAEGWLSVSPVIDPQSDNDHLYDELWELLVHKANNDPGIVALYQTLHWTQSFAPDQAVRKAKPISRDLPGDALNR
ncbi:hypothetical protein RA27_06175 [Ruegeria sp. ANG-R]|uniref:hypothetical protein n=1 Tax=Ruegeria sp. ANG-R TaxID=1577903 RepID=UPI0005804FE5|nr:hypothetical protein [Ruegeria sp. ANG-R]KIC42911.1 hypothetical protein RA27_06175 [Ruegeria sp. ANG-R]